MSVRKVMRMPAVLAATGWAKPTIYLKIAEGKFPKGTKLDPAARAVVWFEDEIAAFQSGTWKAPTQTEAA